MDVEIYKFLFDYGCCDICCLRFLKARGSDYSNVDSFLLKVGHEVIRNNPVLNPLVFSDSVTALNVRMARILRVQHAWGCFNRICARKFARQFG